MDERQVNQVVPVTAPMWVLLRWMDEEAQVQPVMAWEVAPQLNDPLVAGEDEYEPVLYPMVLLHDGAFAAHSVRTTVQGQGVWSVWPSAHAAVQERQRLVEAGVDW